MFLSHPLADVLAGRGIEDIDAFLKAPSIHDLPDPFSIFEPVPIGRDYIEDAKATDILVLIVLL